MKLTKKQEKIYNLLINNKTPLSAEELFESLKDGTMNLSTVYRSLEKFYKLGLVSRNYLDNTAYYYLNETIHHHFMICEKCQKKFMIDCHIDDVIRQIEKEEGFKVNHHDLNFYGICKNCLNKSN